MRILAFVTFTMLLVGCAGGHDAVVHGGQFQFVSPGGKTEFHYEPAATRQHIGQLSGQLLSDSSQLVTLENYSHSIVLINVWGQWCSPCRQEAASLAHTAQLFANKGVYFLGINFRDDRTQALDFINDNHIGYPSIFDPSGQSLRALKDFPTPVLPISIILDKHHRVTAIFLRKVTALDIIPILNQLVGEQ